MKLLTLSSTYPSLVFFSFIFNLINFVLSDESNALHDPTQEVDYVDKIKNDLKELIVVRIDTDNDGSVSFEELKNYLAKLHDQNIELNVDRQWIIYNPQIHEVFSWEGYEPEKKEVLTWDHYFNQTYPELIGVDIPGIPIVRQQATSAILDAKLNEDTNTQSPNLDNSEDDHLRNLKIMAKRADERWKLADENGDTLLTKSEFKLLLHPDEGNEELQKLYVREATEDMDLSQDGKIDLNEFVKHLETMASDQERSDPSWMAIQKENFAQLLDKNKDGSLDEPEIVDWLVPSRSKKFQMEATRLISIGDRNDDSKLSQSEILQNYEHFIGLFSQDYWQKSNPDETDLSESDHDDTARDEL